MERRQPRVLLGNEAGGGAGADIFAAFEFITVLLLWLPSMKLLGLFIRPLKRQSISYVRVF